MIGMNEDDPYEIEAEDKREAYFNFLQTCLGIRLTEFQKEDSLKELCVGNPIFDMIECEEILE